MTVISSITTAAKKFAGKPMAVTSKVLGVATVASVLYDAHINGREKAYSLDEVSTADRFYNQYKQYMSMDKPSATLAKAKKLWFDAQQSFTYDHLFTRAKGYCVGFGKTLLRGIPLLGLSALALKFKTVGKIAGGLLAANGVKTLVYDVLGYGNKKAERKY